MPYTFPRNPTTMSIFVAICLIETLRSGCAAAQAPQVQSPPVERAPADTAKSFKDAVEDFHVIHDFRFGTGASGGESVRTTLDLQKYFIPYGIAGRTVINREWQRYQPFNPQNFVFTTSALNLTALLTPGRILGPGNVTSGQIWSREVFAPGMAGQSEVAISVRMKIPSARGGWPAVWLYTKEAGRNDASEIDNPEFFNETNQNQFDWTGYQHGPGSGRQLYSIMTNKWVWHPGLDFSSDYHDFQTLWTSDAVYKYVDGRLVLAQLFKWTAKGPAQLGIDLAVGTDDQGAFPGLQPNSSDEFPIVLSVESIKIWAK